jgi:hypothetical protein
MNAPEFGPRPDSRLSPAEEDVAAIVTIGDPVERNAAITRGYHALAHAVADVLGRDDTNWLCFGQWASAEAGRSIRGESLPALLRPLIADGVSAAVATGNAAVFGDVAPPFIRFVQAIWSTPAAADDPVAAADVFDRLAAHPQLAASADLRAAFRAYLDALFLRSDPHSGAAKRRAERMLVANASIGAHEQIIADPHVRAAIPGRSIIAIASTAHLGLRIPDGVLALNRDVPRPAYLGGQAFPSDLLTLEDPEAIALARRFGQDLASARHSDAPDWERYEERMGFIFTLLRAYQQDPAMFALPPLPGDELPESTGARLG